MVLSGPGIHANDPNGIGFQGVVTHEMGHALNLAHSQANGAVWNPNVYDSPQPEGCAAPWTGGPSAAQVETMYPISTPEPGDTGEYMGTVDRLDDMSAVVGPLPRSRLSREQGNDQRPDPGFLRRPGHGRRRHRAQRRRSLQRFHVVHLGAGHQGRGRARRLLRAERPDAGRPLRDLRRQPPDRGVLGAEAGRAARSPRSTSTARWKAATRRATTAARG